MSHQVNSTLLGKAEIRGSSAEKIALSTEPSGTPEAPKEQAPAKVFVGAVYECVRCGTRTTQEELSKLPEVKCICGYRVFKKARPSVVKQIKAV
jgi:DNA-directed RNA polymerase subunit P